MKVRLFSYYDHFSHHNPVDNEPYIDMYNDEFVTHSTEGSCALMIEPRSICPGAYKYVEKNWRKFKYIFTHDSKLLNMCDNAKLIIWGFGNGNYYSSSNVIKTKNISMVCSNKDMCREHIERIELARALKDNPYVDVMGTVDDGEWVDTKQIYTDYKFSIAFENYIDGYWMTEKVFNCFANKTIPIYIGAKRINEFFNVNGIVMVSGGNVRVIDLIKEISQYGFDKFYEKRKEAIEDNYQRVQKYKTFEEWFFKEYGDLLNEY